MSLTGTIKSIQNIMRKDRGVDGDAQRISQLSWILFLKIFDDREKELELLDKKYKSPIPEQLRWKNWAEDEEGITGDELLKFINDNLFPTLKDLPARTDEYRKLIIKGVFEDSFNYMKSGTLIRQVINKINMIDFNKKEDRHLFNDIYEKILKDLQGAGNAGEFYTPRAVTQFIVDMIDPKLGEKVFDPATGTGGFLISTLEKIRKNQVKTAEDETLLQKSLYGIEKKQLPYLLSVTNLILHGVDTPSNLRHDNSLTRPLRDYGYKDRVDVIITNPPFGGVEEDGVENNFPKTYRTKETADLFLLLIMHLLKDGGRAGIVLPDGSLSGEGVKQRIREKLLTECNLHTIIRLPNSVFKPYATVKTNLLFFEKGQSTKEVWYFEHPYPESYKSYSKTKPIKVEEFDLEKGWWNKRKEGNLSWKVDVSKIKKNGYNLDIKNPNSNIEEEIPSPKELLKNIGNTNKNINKILHELSSSFER